MNANLPGRRQFLSQLGLAGLGTALAGAQNGEAPKRILLRSSWQTVNIGDIAHTPGVLRLLEKYLPDAELYLWPSKLDNDVDKLLMHHFPKLTLVQGSDALKSAFEKCDFLLHGSGASLVAQRDVERWVKETGKPFGVYGITLPLQKSSSTTATSEEAFAQTIEVLNGARFVYFRDSKSLALAKERGCTCPIMEFGPDGAFACDLRDEDKAEAFLEANDLVAGEFFCCIPRLRYTPYWVIPSKNRAFDEVKHARNEEMKAHDHAQLRTAIIRIARESDYKVLLCPEDQTQMQVGKEVILDTLPEDVLKRVVWRENYWLTGEAISTYDRSLGLFGNEMHSPIMCVGNGTPAIVCRWAEQTTKGFMWEDIGLGHWLFDLDDEEQVAKVVPAIMEMVQAPDKAKATAAKARAFVEERQRVTMGQLKKELAKG